MDNLQYVKARPVSLREVGKDEKWLQDLIAGDITILGLGDGLLIQKESAQPTGGRIDLILTDVEGGVRYEVEIQLGATNADHIVRCIEYWDVERRRFPAYEHRAVIVAEEITNRFFNVIGLLNRSVPMIAIQLNALVLGDQLLLDAVRVLDIVEEAEEPGSDTVADRAYWEVRGSAASLELMDAMLALLPKDLGSVRVKYNRGHVAAGTSGTNFLWFHPRKGGHIHFHIRPGAEARDGFLQKLQEAGVECGTRGTNEIRCILPKEQFESNKNLIAELIINAEQRSRA